MKLISMDGYFNILSSINRRCLCELARQIGFGEKATDLFNLEGQIASYMHLVSIINETNQILNWIILIANLSEQQPEVVKRDIRFARQLRIASKVKVI